MIEQLTDEERALLTNAMLVLGSKALRIIDAHAADRAALVAQLEAANKLLERWMRNGGDTRSSVVADTRTHLAAQPATARRGMSS